MHSFQLKFLRSEISTAADAQHKCNRKRAASREVLVVNLRLLVEGQLLVRLFPSVIFVLRNRVRNNVVSSEQRLQGELARL